METEARGLADMPDEIVALILDRVTDDGDLGACLLASPLFHVLSPSAVRMRKARWTNVACLCAEGDVAGLDAMAPALLRDYFWPACVSMGAHHGHLPVVEWTRDWILGLPAQRPNSPRSSPTSTDKGCDDYDDDGGDSVKAQKAWDKVRAWPVHPSVWLHAALSAAIAGHRDIVEWLRRAENVPSLDVPLDDVGVCRLHGVHIALVRLPVTRQMQIVKEVGIMEGPPLTVDRTLMGLSALTERINILRKHHQFLAANPGHDDGTGRLALAEHPRPPRDTTTTTTTTNGDNTVGLIKHIVSNLDVCFNTRYERDVCGPTLCEDIGAIVVLLVLAPRSTTADRNHHVHVACNALLLSIARRGLLPLLVRTCSGVATDTAAAVFTRITGTDCGAMPGITDPCADRALDDAVWLYRAIAHENTAGDNYHAALASLACDCARAGRADLLAAVGFDLARGNVNVPGMPVYDRWRPLVWSRIMEGAAQGGRLDMVRRCSTFTERFGTMYAVSDALVHGHLDVARYLCASGFYRRDDHLWNERHGRGTNVLYWAICRSHTEAVDILLDATPAPGISQGLVLQEIDVMLHLTVSDALACGDIGTVRRLAKRYPFYVEHAVRAAQRPRRSI